MAALIILASGTSEAASSDVVVAVGSAATVFLTDSEGPGIDRLTLAEVQIQGSGGGYFTVGKLNADNNWQACISAPGIYRVQRKACASACAVEQF